MAVNFALLGVVVKFNPFRHIFEFNLDNAAMPRCRGFRPSVFQASKSISVPSSTPGY
jgi:hypothetical protein